MRILHLSWEYPPVVYGGLGRHVHALADAQAAAGDDVVVVTQGAPGAAADEVVAGVRIVRVPHDAPFIPDWRDRFIEWVFGFNTAVARGAIGVLDGWRPDVVHAHDWLVAQAAVIVRESAGLPLVLTVHATEAGRQRGELVTDQNWAIHSTEWWVAGEADEVIVCSEHMRGEVEVLFDLPDTRVTVIPNGIDPAAWRAPRALVARQREALGAPLVAYAGRLEWEKGVQTLIDAVPRLRRLVPDARAVVIGEGSAAEGLRQRARERRVGRAVTFTGWVSEADLRAIVTAADVAVVPSLYEPFGFVALEAMAMGTPLVVAATGGLAEIVDDGRVGWSFPPGDDAALAAVLAEVLTDTAEAARRARAARREVSRRFAWSSIAAHTREVYAAATAARRPRLERPPYAPGAGSLLARRDPGSGDGRA